MSAFERRFGEIAAVLLFASMVLSLFLEYVVASNWHAARVRDFGCFWTAALLLVFGIRALRRSGLVRSALGAAAAGGLMFAAMAGAAFYAQHVVHAATELVRDGAARNPREEERQETMRAVEELENTMPLFHQTAASWLISGLGCAAVGLLTPIRSRDEGETEPT